MRKIYSCRLRLTSPALARSVYISFGDVDADVSDDYLDLLLGQSVEVTINTQVTEKALRAALKVISLADAFNTGAAVRAGAPTECCRAWKSERWCRRWDLNPRPRDYETLALPLSYTGGSFDFKCYGLTSRSVKPPNIKSQRRV
jgi:hypothetical protein